MIGFLKRLFFRKLVVIDKFGNRYYQCGDLRWVEYKGNSEPNKIPPDLYLWLSHSIEEFEVTNSSYSWERDRIPNLTGTAYAYLPQGHILKNPFREKEKDYIAWEPEE